MVIAIKDTKISLLDIVTAQIIRFSQPWEQGEEEISQKYCI